MAQDKLLDVSGPIAQTFVLADKAMLQGTTLDPASVRDWIQRGICPLRNANTAISAELVRMDVRFSDMAERELEAKTEGKLFGDPVITELRKHAGSFSSLDKSETAMKWVFQPGVFRRAGR